MSDSLKAFNTYIRTIEKELVLGNATDLVPSRLVAEDTEDIELVRVRQDQIPKLIASGEICDAKSIAALLTFLFITNR